VRDWAFNGNEPEYSIKASIMAIGRSNWTIGFVCLLSSVWAWSSGCGNSSAPASNNNGSAGNSGSGGAGTGGVAPSTLPCIAADAGTTRPHDYGNFDYRTCNGPSCHDNWSGGWVYATAVGVPWISGATITLTNSDGTTDTAVSGSTGFFYLENTFVGATTRYTVCASKCPTTYCSTTTHTNRDCLASGCHSSPTQRVFVGPVPAAGTGGAASTGTTTNCTPPASGGPYVHSSATTSLTPCSYGGCHNSPAFTGGFVFDGVTSDHSVAEATVTLTPTSGAPLKAASGPDGMFFLGTRNGTTGTPSTITAPYTPCVSKCPKTVCSPDTSNHTTTDDCTNCHDNTQRIYLQ
jgi:hypothetical protein